VANSRIVSSIRYRGAAPAGVSSWINDFDVSAATRVSTSDGASGADPATRSAASAVKPPANTPRRRNSTCSSGRSSR
jgi:hypothetical protein